MNILMVCRQHPEHLCGGLAIASWNTARLAKDLGHRVLYVTGEHPDGFSGVRAHQNIPVYWVPGMSHEADGYETLYKWLWDNYSILDKEYGPFDIIHSQSSGATPLVDLDPHVPIIFQDHGTQLAAYQDDINITAFGIKHTNAFKSPKEYDKLYDGFDNFISGREVDYLRRFDAVLATSNVSAVDLRTRYFLDNVHLFYHPIYDIQKHAVPANDKITVGFFAFGLDAPHKSVIFGLSKLLPLKDEIRIKLVGGGTSAVKYAKEHFKYVEAVGYVPEDVAKKELASVDVLFECSCHHRGLNLTGITALGMGIPILAFPTAGHADLIGIDDRHDRFGPGGAIVDPFDDEAIISTLKTLVERREKISSSAVAHFEQRFSPAACADRLDAVYRSIVPAAVAARGTVITPAKTKHPSGQGELTVVVPPGIGDTFWIYQKLVTLGLPINFIVCDHGDKNRTAPLMELLPYAKSCIYSKEYTFAKHLRKEGIPANTTKDELLGMANPILMEVNTHLEAGRKLSDWLPDVGTEYYPEIRLSDEDLLMGQALVKKGGHLCIFAASDGGTTNHVGSWKQPEWLDFILRFKKDIRDVPVVIIGAQWDVEFAAKLEAMCKEKGVKLINTTARLPLSSTLDVIKRSCYFIGFPSGLGILAAAMRQDALMFYVKTIEGIMHTFADPNIIKAKIFSEILFQHPSEVIEYLKEVPAFKGL